MFLLELPGVTVKAGSCDDQSESCHPNCPRTQSGYSVMGELPDECYGTCHRAVPCNSTYIVSVNETRLLSFRSFLGAIDVTSYNWHHTLGCLLELELLHRQSIPELVPFLVDGTVIHFYDSDDDCRASRDRYDSGCHCRSGDYCTHTRYGVVNGMFKISGGRVV